MRDFLAIVEKSRQSLNAGVIGMNFRNRHMVDYLNSRPEMAVARDKIATKERLTQYGIATPATLITIRRGRDIGKAIDGLESLKKPFVVKPSRSARGRGILLCSSIDTEGITKLSGEHLPREELIFHLHQILHGEFSFGRPSDTILIEEMVTPDRNWILKGLPGPPDLRIVVCMGKILLAMARLPTSSSDGRANLHCGAVGVGIDPSDGKTRGGVLLDRPVENHPDFDVSLDGHSVEDFDKCMDLALRCCEAFQLGFMGVDIMRDVESGPMVIEVNARPGLGLQIANRTGILRGEQLT